MSKPLFPSAIVFHTTESKNEISDGNDLASLKLDLAPSTFEAIIAAQNSTRQSAQGKDADVYRTGSSLEEEVKGSTKVNSLETHRSVSPTESGGDDLSYTTSTKRQKKSKKHRDKKKHKRRRHSSSDSTSYVEESPQDQPVIPKHAVFLDDIKNIHPSKAFLVDRTRNKDLLLYEAVSKLHIAKYRHSSFNCLGAPHLFLRGAKNGGKDDKKWKLLRYFKKEGLKHSYRKGLGCVSNGKSKALFSNNKFLALPNDSEKKQKMDSTGSYSCLDEATKLFVHGKGASTNTYTEETGDNFIMGEIFEKVKHFNQRTQDEPHNVQLWLDFVEFQDVVAQETSAAKTRTVRLKEMYKPPKSVIEKKLAILEKAIEKNPSALELKLVHMEICQDIWEPGKLEKSWADLLFVHSANVKLWRHYISRQQSRLSNFSFGRVVKCYHKCFKTTVSILDGTVVALNKKDDMEEEMIGLFSQYCDFLHQSGYTERALSSYQAVIEFNLFCPALLNLTTTQERLKQFEAFWESLVPRFGEQNAKGWAQWTERGSRGSNPAPESDNLEEQENAILLEKLARAQSWLRLERVRQNFHCLPWRPDSNKGETVEDCEDLDRVVLFEDIGPAIFRVTRSESCVLLVCLFLKFLGLSCPTIDKKLEEVSAVSSRDKTFEQYGCSSAHQVPSLSCLKSMVNVDSTWQPQKTQLEFIREILTQTERYFSQSNRVTFTLLRLQLEILKQGVQKVSEVSVADVKFLKRLGKNLLKESQNRNNLRLWDTYIRLLWACSDKMEETVAMLNTALSMFMGRVSAEDVDGRLGLFLLCKTYSQIMLNFEPLEHIKASGHHSAPGLEDKQQVISCLGALIENKQFKPSQIPEVSPAYVLKVRKRFQTLISETYNKRELKFDGVVNDWVISVIDCFALFEFCASEYSAANSIYESVRSDVCKVPNCSNSVRNHLKYLCRSQLLFIMNVMQVSIIPLSEMRTVLNEVLQVFPECPEFHSLFLEMETGSFIAGRLRRFYDRSLRNPVSVVIPLFAVMSELTRHYTVVKGTTGRGVEQTVADTGIVHRIRSVFEYTVEAKVSSHCPLLWRMYLMFEAQFGSKNRAKGIFYRALQNCPWSKCIYMDGIEVFRDEELQEVLDLMTEAEIRVRMPLEELDLLLGATGQDQSLVDDGQQLDTGCASGNEDGSVNVYGDLSDGIKHDEDSSVNVRGDVSDCIKQDEDCNVNVCGDLSDGIKQEQY